MSKFLFVVLLAVALATVEAARPKRPKVDCKVQLYTSDTCMQSFMFIREPFTYKMPRTDAALQRDFCDRVPTELSCIRGLRPCFKSFSRTLYDVIVRNVKNFMKDACKNTANRAKMINNLKCWDEGDRITFSKKQSDGIALLIDYAATKPQDEIIPFTCCSYHYSLNKFKVLYKELCQSKGIESQENDNYFVAMVKAIMGDAFDLICAGKFGTLDSCKSSQGSIMVDIKSFDSRLDIAKLNHSLIVPAVKLLEAIERDYTVS